MGGPSFRPQQNWDWNGKSGSALTTPKIASGEGAIALRLIIGTATGIVVGCEITRSALDCPASRLVAERDCIDTFYAYRQAITAIADAKHAVGDLNRGRIKITERDIRKADPA